jgi:hypothetical protein
VLADNPGLTPDQLKAQLLGNTDPGPVGNPFVDGHGALNAYAAATSGPMNLSQSTFLLLPTLPGLTVSLAPTSETDSWNPNLWSGFSPSLSPSNGTVWAGDAWNGAAWDGTAWDSRAWNQWAWAGAGWNGAAWDGTAWDSRAWNQSGWNGAAWSGAAWNSSAWS